MVCIRVLTLCVLWVFAAETTSLAGSVADSVADSVDWSRSNSMTHDNFVSSLEATAVYVSLSKSNGPLGFAFVGPTDADTDTRKGTFKGGVMLRFLNMPCRGMQ